jgi:cupin fold WbuC family metalloprotein
LNASVKYLGASAIDAAILKELRALPFSPTGTRRICLHASPEAPFHVMLVETQAGSAFPPHLHTDSDELSVAVEGILEIVAWADGFDAPSQVFTLGPGGVPSVLMRRGVPHRTRAIGGDAVYLEAKLGPFRADALVKYEDRG